MKEQPAMQTWDAAPSRATTRCPGLVWGLRRAPPDGPARRPREHAFGR